MESGGAKIENDDVEPEGHAVLIEVRWSDGLHHRWTYRQAESQWDLALESPGHGTMNVTGYKREDMERVLGRALRDTVSGLEFGGDVFMPGQSPLDVSKEQMVGLVGDLLDWIKADDSMEGSLSYEWHPEKPGHYRVAGVLRMGNSQGQGGVRLLRADVQDVPS